MFKKIKSNQSLFCAKFGNNRNSFSLLEIMIATMVLTIAIFGICSTLLSIVNLSALTKEKQYVINYARKIMEEVRATPFDEISYIYKNKDVPVPGLNIHSGDPDGEVANVKVAELDETGEFLEVVVKLDWKGKAGERSFTLISRIAKVGDF